MSERRETVLSPAAFLVCVRSRVKEGERPGERQELFGKGAKNCEFRDAFSCCIILFSIAVAKYFILCTFKKGI